MRQYTRCKQADMISFVSIISIQGLAGHSLNLSLDDHSEDVETQLYTNVRSWITLNFLGHGSAAATLT